MYCILEKDDKTHNYIQYILNHNDYTHVAAYIQVQELKHHLTHNPTHTQEQLQWIDTNAHNMRCYVNALYLTAIIYKQLFNTTCINIPTLNNIIDRYNSMKLYDIPVVTQ